MQISVCLERIFIGMALTLILFVSTARAEMASVYGGRDGYCGSRRSLSPSGLSRHQYFSGSIGFGYVLTLVQMILSGKLRNIRTI
jgi:hypothetical protein